ncbi:MAG: hypothetical protein ACLRRB_00030, partial [Ruminococcus sp.]
MLMGAPRNTLRVFNAEYHCAALYVVAHKLLNLFYGAVVLARLFPYGEKAVMAYPPTGSVQTECTRLPVMLRTKGRSLSKNNRLC